MDNVHYTEKKSKKKGEDTNEMCEWLSWKNVRLRRSRRDKQKGEEKTGEKKRKTNSKWGEGRREGQGRNGIYETRIK
jgi:hypothetical protein